MAQLPAHIMTRILYHAGSPAIWKCSMGTSEQMIAFVIRSGGNTSGMDSVVWETETILASVGPDDPRYWITHRTGIDGLIRYCIRTNSWLAPRSEARPINLIYRNLRHRRIDGPGNGGHGYWLAMLKSVPKYDGSSKSIPKSWKINNPFHAQGLDWDEHNRPVEYDAKFGRFIRRVGFDPPSCYCGASLEWRHQEWPHITERCRLCKVSVAAKESGLVQMGGRNEYDYGLIHRLAKEWTSTIQWICDNIKVVIPASLLEQTHEYLGKIDDTVDMPGMVTLTGDESRIQAVWETDRQETKRYPNSDELLEFEIANWNSMFKPQLFPPSVLYPSSPKWAVRIEVLLSPNSSITTLHKHPNTTIPELAQDILSTMGLDAIQHRTQLSLTQNGVVITAGNEQGHRDRRNDTIASSEWITPIRVQCIVWDEYDEGTDYY